MCDGLRGTEKPRAVVKAAHNSLYHGKLLFMSDAACGMNDKAKNAPVARRVLIKRGVRTDGLKLKKPQPYMLGLAPNTG